MKSKTFDAIAYVLFDRKRSLAFCVLVTLMSIWAELHLRITGLFACSGAVTSLAGLFLNIKYSLNFHLKIPKVSLVNKLMGAGVFGTSTVTTEMERWADGILADEMFGVAFMIIGTLIWAYGSYLMPAPHLPSCN
jgi:hypothetical protein